jgi:hypothetical protein
MTGVAEGTTKLIKGYFVDSNIAPVCEDPLTPLHFATTVQHDHWHESGSLHTWWEGRRDHLRVVLGVLNGRIGLCIVKIAAKQPLILKTRPPGLR